MHSFSFSRLLFLIKTWWLEHKFSFLLGIAGLIGLHTLAGWYWLSLNHATTQKFLQIYLTLSLLFVQTQRISNSFKALHKPTTSIRWLLLPASPAEKFFAEFFWQTIIFMLCGIGITLMSEEIFIKIAESRFLSNPIKYSFYSSPTGEGIFSRAYFNLDNNFLKISWGFWLIGQFLFYLGAIRFKRGGYIATGLIIFLSIYLFGYYVRALKAIFFNT